MEEKDNKSIEDAMIDSIAIDKVRDLVSDVAEVGLDSVLEVGLLKDIPLIGFVAKSVGAAFAIRDRIFLKKVLLFLMQLDSIPQHKKQEFVDSLKDDKARQKVGETLILLIDRLDDMDKAEILGRLFKAYVEKEITYPQFRRLSSIIERIFTDDLVSFVNEYNNIKQGIKDDSPSFIREELSNVGLMNRPEPLTSHSSYEITPYGDKLFEVVLKDRLEENK